MRIYPAPHYTMGGLWVDYNLASTIPGLFVIGEANFSDHGANRLGASALMQGLADGYFILPYTVGDYLAQGKPPDVGPDDPAVREVEQAVRDQVAKLLSINGSQPVDAFHRKLGRLMLDECGMVRTRAGLEKALSIIPELREEFWKDVSVPGSGANLNQALEKAGRAADFFDLAELMCRDALGREESCGGHFREEHQTEEGEAQRDDENFAHVAVWEYQKEGVPVRHVEPLTFEHVPPTQRSYK
jgi:succinate dehydrogenase / fumarate reductase flavoprotein subunit